MKESFKHYVTFSLAAAILCLLFAACQKRNNVPSSQTTPAISISPEATSSEPTSTPSPAITSEATTVPTATSAPDNTPTAEEIKPQYSTDYHDYESMAELLSTYHIKFGTVVNGMTVNSKEFQSLVKTHFNSITAANEMKAYSLLNQSASQKDPDQMPVMNYAVADSIMDFAQENQIAVRGHNLVWDAYMCDWFFREGYRNDGAYVDADTMKQRMKYYITQVVTHFETQYPGVIYAWDVVNEAVGDNSSEYNSADPRHLRTSRSGGPNCFYEHVGEDYVELAFLYAKDAIDACNSDVKLIYNDYNAFQKEKCQAICELVKSINSYVKSEDGSERKLCDGVGMQGYIGGYGVQDGCLNPNDITRLETAIHAYADLGVEVQITEMAVRNFDSSEESIQKHAQFYRDLFTMFLGINHDDSNPLTGISIWALFDDTLSPSSSYTYRLNSPYGGLFTANYQVKEAFYRVYDLLTNY